MNLMTTIATALPTAVLGLAASAGEARADGWWENCHCRGGSPSAAQVGAGLLLVGFVAYRLARKRRS